MTDERERLARWISEEAEGHHGDYRNKLRAIAAIILAPAVPEGWRLVPVDDLIKQFKAASETAHAASRRLDAAGSEPGCRYYMGRDEAFEECRKALELAAAPQPKGPADGK